MKTNTTDGFMTNLGKLIVHASYVFIITSTATAAVVLTLRALAR